MITSSEAGSAAPCTIRTRESRVTLGVAGRVVDVEIGIVGKARIQRHAEQALLAAEVDRLGQVEDAGLLDFAVVLDKAGD